MPQTDQESGDHISTREKILLTAESLFATKGIDAVSLNEINKAAGQKNTSSLHYHFGSKQGLIEAIVYTNYEEIEDKLQLAMDALEASGSFVIEDLVIAATSPFIDKLETERGINYLIIVTQLLNKSADMLVNGHPSQKDQARLRVFSLYDQLISDISDDVKMTRIILFSSLLFHSLASYAQFQKNAEANPLGDKNHFVGNLLEVLYAMITAPVKPEFHSLKGTLK